MNTQTKPSISITGKWFIDEKNAFIHRNLKFDVKFEPEYDLGNDFIEDLHGKCSNSPTDYCWDTMTGNMIREISVTKTFDRKSRADKFMDKMKEMTVEDITDIFDHYEKGDEKPYMVEVSGWEIVNDDLSTTYERGNYRYVSNNGNYSPDKADSEDEKQEYIKHIMQDFKRLARYYAGHWRYEELTVSLSIDGVKIDSKSTIIESDGGQEYFEDEAKNLADEIVGGLDDGLEAEIENMATVAKAILAAQKAVKA